ncbi:MAG: hypothetical protein K9L56_15595 [Clostridiales bacterium]|nr:hypothetical protein [Clostridiales bacterium]
MLEAIPIPQLIMIVIAAILSWSVVKQGARKITKTAEKFLSEKVQERIADILQIVIDELKDKDENTEALESVFEKAKDKAKDK